MLNTFPLAVADPDGVQGIGTPFLLEIDKNGNNDLASPLMVSTPPIQSAWIRPCRVSFFQYQRPCFFFLSRIKNPFCEKYHEKQSSTFIYFCPVDKNIKIAENILKRQWLQHGLTELHENLTTDRSRHTEHFHPIRI